MGFKYRHPSIKILGNTIRRNKNGWSISGKTLFGGRRTYNTATGKRTTTYKTGIKGLSYQTVKTVSRGKKQTNRGRNTMNYNAQGNTPWYRSDIYLIIFSVLIFPLGIALVWLHPEYSTQKKVIWTFAVLGFLLLVYTGWFGAALIASAAVWTWTYKKHPAESAADAPSGRVCAYCGAQLPNSGVCSYCGGRTDD